MTAKASDCLLDLQCLCYVATQEREGEREIYKFCRTKIGRSLVPRETLDKLTQSITIVIRLIAKAL